MKDARFNNCINVVGEFGRHGLPVEGHLWNPGKHNWGYGGLPKDKEEYFARYGKSLDQLNELKAQGVAAGIYTQTTDVEGEINGLLTYDRKVPPRTQARGTPPTLGTRNQTLKPRRDLATNSNS